MGTRKVLCAAFGAVFALLLQLSPVQAQATRTWVSGVGDDANPCSRTAPCKTFAGAIGKTADGGEISVLDSGSFGVVMITKSISIVAQGSEGGILAPTTNGIIVNAGPDDAVNLRGLIIEGAGTGLNGIRFLAGGRLHVSDCLIRGFTAGTGLAIDVQAAGPSRVFVSNCTLADNIGGILVKPTGTKSLVVHLDDARVEGNSGAGITADGGKAFVRLNNSTIANNGKGLVGLNNAKIQSYGNNAIHGNGTNGNPTDTIPLK
jgi:hypothetical protein